jgi:large subunit ribosomal protein L15
VKLNQLKPGLGAVRSRKRVGHGPGSGHGKRCCRGNKGQKARNKVKIWFEGGQMPLQRRLPKRGFKNPGREEYEVVNLKRIAERFTEGEEVNPDTLRSKKLIRKSDIKIKILADGEVGFPLNFTVHAISVKAKEVIERVGGTVSLLE